MKQSLMQESGCPNLIRNSTKVTCQESDVRGVITIPWSVLSESPPKALSFLTECLIAALPCDLSVCIAGFVVAVRSG